jgi:hypothetical protein
MRVVVHVKAHFDWEPVPPDVVVTDADQKTGRVRPAANGGWLMQVTRKRDTHTEVAISEASIIGRIIHEHMPQYGGRTLTRKQAVANFLAMNIMPLHAHPKHFTDLVVDVDDGPDEKLFREMIAPFTTSVHASGEMLIDPSDVEALVTAYMQSADAAAHQTHLHEHFSIKKAVAK